MKKIIQKIIYFLPFYIVLFTLLNFLLDKSITLVFVGSIVASIFKVFYNTFDYDFYNDISPDDYLESKHKAKVSYSKEKWNTLKNMNEIISNKLNLLEDSENTLKYSIKPKKLIPVLNSILTIEHIENDIFINIQKAHITFLPDKAKNYKIIKKIVFKLENLQ